MDLARLVIDVPSSNTGIGYSLLLPLSPAFAPSPCRSAAGPIRRCGAVLVTGTGVTGRWSRANQADL